VEPEDESSSSGSDFITDPTGGCFNLPPGVLAHCTECDFWQQDCMVGEACKPWANDGGMEWNAARCGAVDADPGEPGDPCVVVGSSWSGIDSCDVGGFCWNVDLESSMGECVALCDGTKQEPACPGGGTCVLANDGYLPLCLPACDPLTPTCDEGQGGYPGWYDDFVCLREGDDVYTDAPHPTCAPGSFALVDGTCVTFCDLSAKTSCDDGFTCMPYFQGKAPAEYANVGGCLPTM